MVDELYAWLRANVGHRADVEQMAVAGRRSTKRGGGVRRLVGQAVDAADIKLPLPDPIPLGWRVFDPPASASTDPQAVLFGLDGGVEGPTDIRFEDGWVRFETESEANIVRSLAAADLLRGPVVIPGPEAAPEWLAIFSEFVAAIPQRLDEELADRIGRTDPTYSEAFALALSAATERLREEMVARVEDFRRKSAGD
jgi:hypothetical protein